MVMAAVYRSLLLHFLLRSTKIFVQVVSGANTSPFNEEPLHLTGQGQLHVFAIDKLIVGGVIPDFFRIRNFFLSEVVLILCTGALL